MHPVAAVFAQQTGQGLYADDRGTAVVGVYRWLGDRGAGLLAEISQDEAFGSARQLALTIGIVGLVSTLLLVAGIYLRQGIFAYVCISYFVSYGAAVIHLNRAPALLGVFAAGIVAVVLCGVFGSLSDRIGRKTTYLIGAVAMAVSVIPAIALINTGNPWLFGLAPLARGKLFQG